MRARCEREPELLQLGSGFVLYALMVIAVVFSIVSKIRARKTADF